MTTKKKPNSKGAPAAVPGVPEGLAKLVLSPSVNAGAVVSAYAGPFGVKESDDIGALQSCIADGVKDVWAGDMKRAEAMLYGQALALQAIFMNLARRATKQEYMKHWEGYLRMALKAQGQCRATLETLAAIKNPPVVFARQANIAHGPQQVNNGTAPDTGQQPARAANSTTTPTGLLEQQHGQWMVPAAPGTAGSADSHLAPVGAVNRPANA